MQMGIPDTGSGMPATARAMMETLFMGWFTDAMASTFVVAVVLAVIGGLCALLLRSHVQDAQDGRRQRRGRPSPVRTTPVRASLHARPRRSAAEWRMTPQPRWYG